MNRIFRPFTSRFAAVSGEKSILDSDPQLYRERRTTRSSRALGRLTDLICIIWVLSPFVLSILLQRAYSENHKNKAQGTFETGFDSELDSIKPQISLKPVQFTNGLYSENGTTQWSPQSPVWIDVPSPELDARWNELLKGANFEMPSEEVEAGVAKTIENEFGDSESRISSYHSLYCINKLRQLVDYDYYFTDINVGYKEGQAQMYHCLDYLRQSIQCAADLTPYTNGKTTTHMCRDWDRVGEWVKEQSNENVRLPDGIYSDI